MVGWQKILAGVSGTDQSLRYGLDGVCQACALAKRCPVVEASTQSTCLRAEEFDHFADGHTRGEAVRVHDEVRADAGLAEGHVGLCDNVANHTLLPVTAAELVTELGSPRVPDLYLGMQITAGPCVSQICNFFAIRRPCLPACKSLSKFSQPFDAMQRCICIVSPEQWPACIPK